MQYKSKKPIKSKLTYHQWINQLKDLQWKSTLDWLIWSTVEKIAPRGWFPGGSKKWPNTRGTIPQLHANHKKKHSSWNEDKWLRENNVGTCGAVRKVPSQNFCMKNKGRSAKWRNGNELDNAARETQGKCQALSLISSSFEYVESAKRSSYFQSLASCCSTCSLTRATFSSPSASGPAWSSSSPASSDCGSAKSTSPAAPAKTTTTTTTSPSSNIPTPAPWPPPVSPWTSWRPSSPAYSSAWASSTSSGSATGRSSSRPSTWSGTAKSTSTSHSPDFYWPSEWWNWCWARWRPVSAAVCGSTAAIRVKPTVAPAAVSASTPTIPAARWTPAVVPVAVSTRVGGRALTPSSRWSRRPRFRAAVEWRWAPHHRMRRRSPGSRRRRRTMKRGIRAVQQRRRWHRRWPVLRSSRRLERTQWLVRGRRCGSNPGVGLMRGCIRISNWRRRGSHERVSKEKKGFNGCVEFVTDAAFYRVFFSLTH